MVLLVYFLVVTAFASFEATFALYSERRFGFTAATIGYMFAWIGVVLATVQGVLVGRVVKRVGEKRLVPLAIFVIALALGLVPVAGTVPLLAAVAGLLAIGMGFNSPSMLSAISQLADPRDQGSTLGVSQSLGSLARIIGPLWGGWVFDQFGVRFPFFTSAAVMLLACALSVVAFNRVELGPPPPRWRQIQALRSAALTRTHATSAANRRSFTMFDTERVSRLGRVRTSHDHVRTRNRSPLPRL